jgi:hypothetical protein
MQNRRHLLLIDYTAQVTRFEIDRSDLRQEVSNAPRIRSTSLQNDDTPRSRQETPQKLAPEESGRAG